MTAARSGVFDDVEKQFLKELRRSGWSIHPLRTPATPVAAAQPERRWTANHRGLRGIARTLTFASRRDAITFAVDHNTKVVARAAGPAQTQPHRGRGRSTAPPSWTPRFPMGPPSPGSREALREWIFGVLIDHLLCAIAEGEDSRGTLSRAQVLRYARDLALWADTQWAPTQLRLYKPRLRAPLTRIPTPAQAKLADRRAP